MTTGLSVMLVVETTFMLGAADGWPVITASVFSGRYDTDKFNDHFSLKL